MRHTKELIIIFVKALNHNSMNNASPYIKQIKIVGLCGTIEATWHLKNGVNILSGINGSGKSTLLQALGMLLTSAKFTPNPQKPIDGIEVIFEDGTIVNSDDIRSSPINRNINMISTFDTALKMMEALQKLSDGRVRSDLDWELYVVCERYVRYQLKMGRAAVDILMSESKKSEHLHALIQAKERYFNIIDSMLGESGKKIARESDEIELIFGNITLSPYQLSSGEKQLLIILTTVLVQNMEPYVLIMDEPEISLHFDWQRKLLGSIMELNPNLQVIISTHSPAVIMDGWVDRVQDISDLVNDTVSLSKKI